MAAGPRDTPPGRDTAAEPQVPPEPSRNGAIPDSRNSPDSFDALESLGSLEPIEAIPSMEEGQSFRELRPQRLLRIWQLAPIVALAVGGSLMFAFPLAFESGDGGPVVAMLGLLLCCCSAGWGLMAVRRVGHTWPGLPARGSGARADWRYVTGYTAVIALLAVLAVWRVARLR
jgi:hypothetical protein